MHGKGVWKRSQDARQKSAKTQRIRFMSTVVGRGVTGAEPYPTLGRGLDAASRKRPTTRLNLIICHCTRSSGKFRNLRPRISTSSRGPSPTHLSGRWSALPPALSPLG